MEVTENCKCYGDESVLKSIMVVVAQLCEILKTVKFYTFNG